MEKETVPIYGWKVKLNHVFPEKRNQDFTPSLKIIWSLLGLIIRYMVYMIWCYLRGRRPIMDYIKTVTPKQLYGVPFGGIGGGTIGRGFKGEFCRFALKPGLYEYDTMKAGQFIATIRNSDDDIIYNNVLSVYDPPEDGTLSSWKWNFPGENASYTALYPRSWTEYEIEECKVKLVCRQISPVIPKNYKDSSVPGGVFVWSIINYGGETLNVSITFTLQSYSGYAVCSNFNAETYAVSVKGAEIENIINRSKCTFTFGAKETNNVKVSSAYFNPNSDGCELWNLLETNGHLNEDMDCCIDVPTMNIGCGVCATISVDAHSEGDLEFSFIWHIPSVRFRNGVKKYKRYYMKHFGDGKSTSTSLCCYALANYRNWERKIDDWQYPVLSDESLPLWYKSAIFNELYFISDGGSVWVQMNEEDHTKLTPNDVRKEYGRFAYLEGHEYRMYNTYDVHFYASFALADLWPKLQHSIQYEFREAISAHDPSFVWYKYDGKFGIRKEADTVPHDVGEPESEPFCQINAYMVHDVSHWKDLNLKFVLQCYRDYVFTEDETYLRDMWPQVKLLMERCLEWDTDSDGMIENSGFPDQTYDAWTMSGVSAYCGGLWLAALCCTVKMATVLDEESVKGKYAKVLEKATDVYNRKLWNGNYYEFDTDVVGESKTIMADQMCGMWYLHACGITDVLPVENVEKALKTIYENNVMKFKNGESGAVNGMTPNGAIDTFSVQSQEVWTGVTYALASHLIFQNKKAEGLTTASGIYNTVYNKIGMAFDTPEALYKENYIRAVGYMRPLSIWCMQLALNKLKMTAIE